MDAAVSLVSAYLQANGFLTVAEYPILESSRHGTREVTDVDLLALRPGAAGRVLPRPGTPAGPKMDNDPALDLKVGRSECIIAEVKEGVGGMNPAMWRRAVLFECIRRFGVADRAHLHRVTASLADTGSAHVEGTRFRLVSFSREDDPKGPPHAHIPLQHVVSFLDAYLDHYAQINTHIRFRDPMLSTLSLLRRLRSSG